MNTRSRTAQRATTSETEDTRTLGERGSIQGERDTRVGKQKTKNEESSDSNILELSEDEFADTEETAKYRVTI